MHSGHKLLLTTTQFVLDPPSSATTTDSTPTLRIIIGITGLLLLQNKKHSEYLQPWPERAHNVLTFLVSILTFSSRAVIHSFSEAGLGSRSIPNPAHAEAKPCTSQSGTTPTATATAQSLTATISIRGGGEVRIEIVEINDPFGPTITNPHIQALVVSDETRGGGLMVNEKRREQGWSELDVFTVGVVMEEDGDQAGEKMSSTEIRKRRGEEKG